MTKISEVEKVLSKVPRVNLTLLPSPIYKLENLSKKFGINLYIKRDDFIGKNLFSGNKIRNIEYLIGDAISKNCDSLLTFGSTQSNHAMQTAWAARFNKLTPILYLVAYVEPSKNENKSNLLLDNIYDSEIHIFHKHENEYFSDVENRSHEAAKRRIEELEASGKKCYEIPMGGASKIGAIGYLNAAIEIQRQLSDMNIKMDYLYHATGSGGTLAGLMAGKKLLNLSFEIRSMAAMKVGLDFEEKVTSLSNEMLNFLGYDGLVSKDDFWVNKNSYFPKYGRPSEISTQTIKFVANEEALLLDPVYTAKAFASMIEDIENNVIEKNSNVLFLHTGGVSSLFAEKEIVGEF